MAEAASKETILKALVGSQAHGLADENSDIDYRGVFLVATDDVLALGGHPGRTSWIERGENGEAINDDVSWEVGHFLHLATKCNPTILECMAAPIFEANEWGREMRALLPCVWNPKGVRDAFVGYGLNQRKKMLDDKDGRPWKYACAYLRTLAAGTTLLTTGEVLVDVRGHPLHSLLVRVKAGSVTKGKVIDTCNTLTRALETALAGCTHEPDLARVNEFLIRLRRANFRAALTAKLEEHNA